MILNYNNNYQNLIKNPKIDYPNKKVTLNGPN